MLVSSHCPPVQLIKKKAAKTNAASMKPTAKFADLFTRYAAYGYLRQFALAKQVGSKNWHADMKAGTISFGGKESHAMQVLGTEAYGDNSWLWAWAPGRSVPPDIAKAASTLLTYGKKNNIPELSYPLVPIAVARGDQFAMIAVGMGFGGSYYSGPINDGAGRIYLVLPGYPTLTDADKSPTMIIKALTSLISKDPVDHKKAVLGLAECLKITCEQKPMAMVLKTDKGDTINIKLDKYGRIADMSTMLCPKTN